jgi:hypothetical protein
LRILLISRDTIGSDGKNRAQPLLRYPPATTPFSMHDSLTRASSMSSSMSSHNSVYAVRILSSPVKKWGVETRAAPARADAAEMHSPVRKLKQLISSVADVDQSLLPRHHHPV